MQRPDGGFDVECPECGEVFDIDGNEVQVRCPECNFKGDQTDFPDADEE